MSDEKEIISHDNGGNKSPPIFPAVIPNPEEEPEKPRERRLSGFARQGYWDEPNKDNPNITNREAKSLWAKKAAQEGLIGGPRPGAGRPRKNNSVAEVVADKSAENADKIAKKLLDLALNHNNPSINLGAVDRLNKYEQDHEKNTRDDEKELRKLSGKSLDQALAEVLEEHGVGYDYDVPEEDVEDV